MAAEMDFPGILLRSKKSKAWHYQVYLANPDGTKGRKVRRSTGKENWQQAVIEAKKIYEELTLLNGSQQDSLRLDEAVVKEVQWANETRGADRAQRVSECMEHFAKWAGNVPLENITTQTLVRYQNYRSKCRKMINVGRGENRKRIPASGGKFISTATIKMEVNYILRMLRRNNLNIPKPDPLHVVEEHPGRPFSAEELVKFLEASDRFPENDPGRYTPLWLIMLCTGARPAEVLPPKRKARTEEEERMRHKPLLKKEILCEKGIVMMRTAKRKPGQRRNETTPIPVPRPVLEMVLKRAEKHEGPYVFEKFQLKNYFDRILKLAELDKEDEIGRKLTAHSLRHTFGTIQAEAGINAFVLKNLMRHSDIRSTERYTQMALKGAYMINPMGLLGGRVEQKEEERRVAGGLHLEQPATHEENSVQVIHLEASKS